MRFAVLVVLFMSLFTVSPLVPGGGAVPTDAGALVVPDPEGDADALDSGVGLGNEQIDIVRLEVGGDDQETLRFALAFAGPPGPLTPPELFVRFGSERCEIEWSYNDKMENFGFRMRFERPEEGSLGHARMSYQWRSEGGSHGYGWTVREVVEYVLANETIVVLLPKEHVAVGDTGRVPAAGDRVTDIQASCGDFDAYDAVDAEGASYALAGSEGVPVTMTLNADGEGGDEQVWVPPPFSGWNTRSMAVAPGGSASFPLTLFNHADSKKIVRLSANVTDWRGDTVDGWSLRVPEHVTVPAAGERVVGVHVAAPEDARIARSVRLEVSGALLGDEGETSTQGWVVVSPPLDQENDRIWFHSSNPTDPSPEDEIITMTGYNGGLHVSTLQHDPRFEDGPVGVTPFDGSRDWSTVLPMPNDVRFETGANVTGRMVIDSDLGTPIEVQIEIDSQSGVIASLRGKTDPSGVADLKGPLLLDPAELPSGERIWVLVRVTDPVRSGEPAGRMTIDPAESWLRFPILPSEDKVMPTDGRWLPTLRLAADEEASTYIGPDGRHDFELMLGNEGMERDDIVLDVRSDNMTGWTVELIPGRVFRVPAGDVTPVAVSVRVDGERTEGERFSVEVTATSKSDPAAVSRLRLDAVVTTGVGVSDKIYDPARSDQIAPLEEKDEDVPASGFVPLLVLFGLLAMLGRRRS